MAWNRLPDADFEAFAGGLAQSEDGEVAIMIQAAKTVIVIDADTAIDFIASIIAVLPYVSAQQMPDLNETGSGRSVRKVNKTVKKNREKLGL